MALHGETQALSWGQGGLGWAGAVRDNPTVKTLIHVWNTTDPLIGRRIIQVGRARPQQAGLADPAAQ